MPCLYVTMELKIRILSGDCMFNFSFISTFTVLTIGFLVLYVWGRVSKYWKETTISIDFLILFNWLRNMIVTDMLRVFIAGIICWQ